MKAPILRNPKQHTWSRSGHRYAYALVAHDASNAAAQLLLENSTLQQLQSAGDKV